MNPDRIYRQYRDDALAKQIAAKEYKTFVAMPFGDQFSYRSRKIYRDVIQKAAARANEKGDAARRFAQPTRVDDHAGTAHVITEEIVVQILESHIFLADLTFENSGVLLETGIALGTKPTPQIVLITQGRLTELHFDIRNNHVICYNPGRSIDAIANAIVAAASAFERDSEKYVTAVTRTLPPDAIACLKRYGEIQQETEAGSLHAGIADRLFPGERAKDRFEAATRDLLRARLLWTDFKVEAMEGMDAFGMHATELGWAVISQLWHKLRRSGR